MTKFFAAILLLALSFSLLSASAEDAANWKCSAKCVRTVSGKPNDVFIQRFQSRDNDEFKDATLLTVSTDDQERTKQVTDVCKAMGGSAIYESIMTADADQEPGYRRLYTIRKIVMHKPFNPKSCQPSQEHVPSPAPVAPVQTSDADTNAVN